MSSSSAEVYAMITNFLADFVICTFDNACPSVTARTLFPAWEHIRVETPEVGMDDVGVAGPPVARQRLRVHLLDQGNHQLPV